MGVLRRLQVEQQMASEAADGTLLVDNVLVAEGIAALGAELRRILRIGRVPAALAAPVLWRFGSSTEHIGIIERVATLGAELRRLALVFGHPAALVATVLGLVGNLGTWRAALHAEFCRVAGTT